MLQNDTQISSSDNRQIRNKPKLLSVVVPCYNEQEVFTELLRRLYEVLTTNNYNFEIVLIDDGSKDSTWHLMQQAVRTHKELKVIKLSTKFFINL